MAVNVNRHGRRFAASGPWMELRGFACALAKAGERVRLNVAWNHSFHDADFRAVVLFGPAVRNPMEVHALEFAADAVEREMCNRFHMSRRAQ